MLAVRSSPTHSMGKPARPCIRLVEGLGVEGDAHFGDRVQHRSRIARDPTQPNLRQVHLLHVEFLDELRGAGFELDPGQMGENVTTRGLDLLGLPVAARLRLGPNAVVEITGLRNPCGQLDEIAAGLMAATLDRDAEGRLVRKAGVMGVVRDEGEIRPGESIQVELPPGPHRPLAPV